MDMAILYSARREIVWLNTKFCGNPFPGPVQMGWQPKKNKQYVQWLLQNSGWEKRSLELVLLVSARKSNEGITVSIRCLGGKLRQWVLVFGRRMCWKMSNNWSSFLCFWKTPVLECHGIEIQDRTIQDITDNKGTVISKVHQLAQNFMCDVHHYVVASTSCWLIAGINRHCSECAYVGNKYQRKMEWRESNGDPFQM